MFSCFSRKDTFTQLGTGNLELEITGSNSNLDCTGGQGWDHPCLPKASRSLFLDTTPSTGARKRLTTPTSFRAGTGDW